MFSFYSSLTEHLCLIYINACCTYSKIKNAAMTAAFRAYSIAIDHHQA